jgi:hypothetical protein
MGHESYGLFQKASERERMIDPTYELLWKKVGEAYAQVDSNAERTIEFEHDKYRVLVGHHPQGKAVVVTIWDDVPVTPPTLIAP